MTEKEYNVRAAEIRLADAETKLKSARRDLETTTREAKAVMESRISKATTAVEEAQHEVNRATAWLDHKRQIQSEGFER